MSMNLPNYVSNWFSDTEQDLDRFADFCHTANERWWQNPSTGASIERNKGELMMLMVSEIAEAMEGARKDLQSDKIPQYTAEEEELADCLIRIFDYSGGFNLRLHGAFEAKMRYNASREDHTHEHRMATGGKQW